MHQALTPVWFVQSGTQTHKRLPPFPKTPEVVHARPLKYH